MNYNYIENKSYCGFDDVSRNGKDRSIISLMSWSIDGPDFYITRRCATINVELGISSHLKVTENMYYRNPREYKGELI